MSFTTEIARFNKGTAAKIQKVRRGVCIALFNSVILDTPVLTGRLRANWKYSEGQPDLQATPDLYDPSGAATAKKATDGVLASTGDKAVFLSNSLPYAARIEFDGWSKVKAPQGMMRKNVVRFNTLITVEAAKA